MPRDFGELLPALFADRSFSSEPITDIDKFITRASAMFKGDPELSAILKNNYM